jgi:hypothetical protein
MKKKKKQYEKQWRINISNLSIIHVTPHFANTMLSPVSIFHNRSYIPQLSFFDSN